MWRRGGIRNYGRVTKNVTKGLNADRKTVRPLILTVPDDESWAKLLVIYRKERELNQRIPSRTVHCRIVV